MNKLTYDILADEYDKRAESLSSVTDEAMTYFAKYLRPNAKVLDVGCGVGLAMNILDSKGFNVSGIDISEAMVRYAKSRNPNLITIEDDFLEYNFSEQYDGVLTFAFLHLFPKEVALKAMEKIKSILKPGGVAFISSTRSLKSFEGWMLKKDYDSQQKRYRKFWTELELEDAFSQIGFRKIDLKIHRDPYEKEWMDFIAQI